MTDNLGDAWNAVTTVLPEGAWVSMNWPPLVGRYRVSAHIWLPEGTAAHQLAEVEGDTPVAALRALEAALSER